MPLTLVPHPVAIVLVAVPEGHTQRRLSAGGSQVAAPPAGLSTRPRDRSRNRPRADGQRGGSARAGLQRAGGLGAWWGARTVASPDVDTATSRHPPPRPSVQDLERTTLKEREVNPQIPVAGFCMRSWPRSSGGLVSSQKEGRPLGLHTPCPRGSFVLLRGRRGGGAVFY